MAKRKREPPAIVAYTRLQNFEPDGPHRKPDWWDEKAARDVYATVEAARAEKRMVLKQAYEEGRKFLAAKGHPAGDSEHKAKRLYLRGKKLHAADQNLK